MEHAERKPYQLNPEAIPKAQNAEPKPKTLNPQPLIVSLSIPYRKWEPAEPL